MNLRNIFQYGKRYLLGYDIQDASLNGEFRMLKKMIVRSSIVFEVGANVGNHMERYLRYNKDVRIHAFEPSPGSFEELKRKFDLKPGVFLNNIALSNSPGVMDFYLYWETGGGNSLYYNEYQAGVSKEVRKIKVGVDTLDCYMDLNKIDKIDFIKMDVEGNEYKVLLGLSLALRNRAVKAIQFEYTPFTNEIGDSLEKIGSLLKSAGFEIYRITPWGKLRVSDFKANEHRSANYLAILGA